MILIVLTSISFDFKRYIINLEQIEKFEDIKEVTEHTSGQWRYQRGNRNTQAANEDTKEVTGTHKRPRKIPKRSPEHTSGQWRYQRGNRNTQAAKKDTKEVTGTHKWPMKIPKRSPEHTSGQKRKNTKGQTMIYETLQRKRWATRISLKTGDEHMCPGRISRKHMLRQPFHLSRKHVVIKNKVKSVTFCLYLLLMCKGSENECTRHVSGITFIR